MVSYRCVCGEESSTYVGNLKRPDRKAQCPKCQNKKLDHEIIMRDFELRGCVLLTPREEYQNNKQNLRYRCSCGAEAEIRYQDLLRGRRCPSCRNDRRIATNMERYGHSRSEIKNP